MVGHFTYIYIYIYTSLMAFLNYIQNLVKVQNVNDIWTLQSYTASKNFTFLLFTVSCILQWQSVVESFNHLYMLLILLSNAAPDYYYKPQILLCLDKDFAIFSCLYKKLGCLCFALQCVAKKTKKQAFVEHVLVDLWEEFCLCWMYFICLKIIAQHFMNNRGLTSNFSTFLIKMVLKWNEKNQSITW